ncbi:MAG: UDP-N-acetylglucosamine 2-epimerase (non-hydrolyzing) [Candidatus Eisenbacteria bacterium]|nr:UDP-N-acetylglucosamine 2-epimerase (non-hydrolyzing) [Candidatus Eisenbacteria bacterium]
MSFGKSAGEGVQLKGKKKVVSIVGARPQFIKCAQLWRLLREHFEEVLVHTGQHYDDAMSRVFFEELEIPEPAYNLEVGSGSHGFQTGEMLKRIEQVLIDESPALSIVYGDTNSTLAGALASSKMGIDVAHVEAGLRSYEKKMPEEINRCLTDHVSALLFCPTETAVQNLHKEGIWSGVHFTGDVMLETLGERIVEAEKRSEILSSLSLSKKGYFLLTVHRAENTDDPERVLKILNMAGKLGRPVVFPVHPRTRKVISGISFSASPQLRMIDPVSYLDMLVLEKNAAVVLTDSGGVQKEAYFFEVPVVTLRNRTEWVETLEGGWNTLCDVDEEEIVDTVRRGLPGTPRRPELFGVGSATGRIVKIIGEFLG